MCEGSIKCVCQEGDKLWQLQWACISVVIKKPNQTHAVYTHCCSTHDQHQESPNNTITQRERKESSMTEHQVVRHPGDVVTAQTAA